MHLGSPLENRLSYLLFAAVAVSLLLVSGCASDYERSKKPAGAWSRGLLLGESNTKQAVALQVDEVGRAHVAWVERLSDQEESLHYVRLNGQAQVEIDQTLSLDLQRPRRPQLLVDEGDQLHLALLSRTDGVQGLYHVPVDAQGSPGEPVRVSQQNGQNVNSFQVYRSPTGDLAFVWDSDSDDGQVAVYHASVEQDGTVSPPTLLVSDAVAPSVLVDPGTTGDETTVHLTWLTRSGFSARDVYYATLQDGTVAPPEGVRISSFNYAESATYQAPAIGLDTETMYVMWSIQNLGGGLTPTAADTYYVTFPPGQPRYGDPISVRIPAEHRPEYHARTGAYLYDELAPLSQVVYGTDYVNAPAVVQSKEAELPVVVSVIIESASKQFMQLAMTVFADGEPVGYQLANETQNASVLPTLVADEEANLHLAWLDTAGFRTYKVYYATTASEGRAWLDRVTLGDVGRGAADVVWGVLSAIGFLPLTVMWNAPALVWLVIFYLISRQELLDELGAKIGLGIAFVVYVAVKMLFLPGLLAGGTPFVYTVPQALEPVVTTAVPIFVFVFALIGLIVYLRRSKGEAPSLFKAYLVFALIDSVLTAILYAPRFFDPRG